MIVSNRGIKFVSTQCTMKIFLSPSGFICLLVCNQINKIRGLNCGLLQSKAYQDTELPKIVIFTFL